MTPIRKIQEESGIIGREDELGLALAVLQTGRHLLFEGPVGVGKTTVALAVCRHLGRDTVRVDGDDRYSESKLTGWFDPPLVLNKGYSEETFFPGPLVQAMMEGSVLFINELNRMPEGVQNVLLPSLDERLLVVPRIGTIKASDGFQVIATQNPVEYIATGHLSEALRDRFEHVALEYQSAGDEVDIVRRESVSDNEQLMWQAVAVARTTRVHPSFKKGASVRAAIAIVTIAEQLTGAGMTLGEALRRAAVAALTTRTELRDELGADFGSALEEIVSGVEEMGPEQLAAAADGRAGSEDDPEA